MSEVWGYEVDPQVKSLVEDLEQEIKTQADEIERLNENWDELLLFAKEHDAGKYLYVEASEFIDEMNKLKGGE